MKEAIITITIGTVIGGTIGAILYKILCSDCTPYISQATRGLMLDGVCHKCWDKMFPDED